MSYAGGKHFLAKKIATYLLTLPCERIVEPFCGALSVTAKLGNVAIASDICKPLITTLRAVQSGWIPPDYVSREGYARYKAAPDPDDPMTAFVGFWHAYGGKWFAGYSPYRLDRASGQKPGGASKSLRRKVAQAGAVDLRCCAYTAFEFGPGDLVYCDPPYYGTTLPGTREPFDHVQFWAWVRAQERRGATVVVSEKTAPDDFAPVLQLRGSARLSKKGNTSRRQECLWRLR